MFQMSINFIVSAIFILFLLIFLNKYARCMYFYPLILNEFETLFLLDMNVKSNFQFIISYEIKLKN